MRSSFVRPSFRTRGGFTLMEILVALVLIGLLVAVVLPSVISQASKGEVNRVAEDLSAVQNAVKFYRVDVQRWSDGLQKLVADPSAWADSTDLFGSDIPGGLFKKWNGPYLELGAIAAGGLETSLGGTVLPAFDTIHWGGTAFVAVRLTGITQSDAEKLSELVDGEAELVRADDTAGRVRWVTGGAADPDTTFFLAAPVN